MNCRLYTLKDREVKAEFTYTKGREASYDHPPEAPEIDFTKLEIYSRLKKQWVDFNLILDKVKDENIFEDLWRQAEWHAKNESWKQADYYLSGRQGKF